MTRFTGIITQGRDSSIQYVDGLLGSGQGLLHSFESHSGTFQTALDLNWEGQKNP